MIVGVRLLAKLTGLESLLIYNSLVHFLAVSALSVGCGILAAECCGVLYGKRKEEEGVPLCGKDAHGSNWIKTACGTM